jgi:hypothetical protein
MTAPASHEKRDKDAEEQEKRKAKEDTKNKYGDEHTRLR